MHNFWYSYEEYIFKNYKMVLSEEFSVTCAGTPEDTLIAMTIKNRAAGSGSLNAPDKKPSTLRLHVLKTMPPISLVQMA